MGRGEGGFVPQRSAVVLKYRTFVEIYENEMDNLAFRKTNTTIHSMMWLQSKQRPNSVQLLPGNPMSPLTNQTYPDAQAPPHVPS